jgi:hypothetical protein
MIRSLSRAAALACAFVLACTFALTFTSPASAQSGAPPQIKWTGGQNWTPNPTYLIGFDSLAGTPCIIGQTTTCSLAGAGGGGGGGAVSIAAGLDVTEGNTTDSACAGPTSTCTIDAIDKAILAASTGAVPCRATSTLLSAVTDGTATPAVCNPNGALIVTPDAPEANRLRAFQSTTGSTAVTLLAAQGSGVKIHITKVQCWNSSGTGTNVTFSDLAGSNLWLPAGLGSNANVDWVVAANTALTFTPSPAETTIGCNVQGYSQDF